jgi:hypothetical protein
LASFGDGDEHDVVIEGAKLGMTVENVLERTVVHDVEPNGPAVREKEVTRPPRENVSPQLFQTLRSAWW